MKKSFSMFVLFVGLATTSFAQMKKGAVTYSMEMTSDDPEMAMATSMMAGSTMTTIFSPGKSRTDVSMGMLGKMSTIVDEKTKKTLMLTDMMGMKYAVEGNVDDMKKDAETPEFTVENTNETKEIAGYKCTKTVLRTTDGMELTGWYTKDIAASTAGQAYYNDKMPGFPLEFSTVTQGMNISFKATNVAKDVAKDAFDMKIPDGFEVKTMDQLMMEGAGEE